MLAIILIICDNTSIVRKAVIFMLKHIQNLHEVLYDLHLENSQETFFESRLTLSIYEEKETGITDMVLFDNETNTFYTLFTFDTSLINDVKKASFFASQMYNKYGFTNSYATIQELDKKLIKLLW